MNQYPYIIFLEIYHQNSNISQLIIMRDGGGSPSPWDDPRFISNWRDNNTMILIGGMPGFQDLLMGSAWEFLKYYRSNPISIPPPIFSNIIIGRDMGMSILGQRARQRNKGSYKNIDQN